MSKVITFSRTYPPYHPRGGEPTFFVEKFWQSIYLDAYYDCIREQFDFSKLHEVGVDIYAHDKYPPKHTTIRAGKRFKAGEWFSPRIWSGKPYRSKQIIVAPDIQVKKTWNLEIDTADVWAIGLPGTQIKYTDDEQDAQIAANDGLTEQDLYWWFKESKKPFIGQIICWNDKVNYEHEILAALG